MKKEMRQKKILSLSLIALFLVPIFSSFVLADYSTQVEFLGKMYDVTIKEHKPTQDFLIAPVIKEIVGIVFGIWDVKKVETTMAAPKFESVDTRAALMIYLMIWLIMFLAFTDIVRLFSPFNNAVGWIMGAALTIIAAQLTLLFIISKYAVFALSYIAVGSIWLTLFWTFILFLFASFGSQWAMRLALRKKIFRRTMTANMNIANVDSGLKVLKKVGKNISE